MQNYKKHKKELFQGIPSIDIPLPKGMKNNSVASKSVHYSGFLVGYMAWGYIICFHVLFFVLGMLRLIRARIRHIELLMTIIVPILVVYLMKLVMVSSVGKFIFIQDLGEKLNLKNRKTYAIFVYFNFFADCFLGIASCIIRLIKSICLNILYMARLDCSFLGRPLEKFDIGFSSYVSYLYMEVTHTHPVMLAFCYSLYDDIINKRNRKEYDNECCIGPSGNDNDVESQITKKGIEHERNNRTRKNNSNGSIDDKNVDKGIRKSSESDSTTNLIQEQKQTQKQVTTSQNQTDDDDDNDDEGLSIKDKESTLCETIELLPKMKPNLRNEHADEEKQTNNKRLSVFKPTTKSESINTKKVKGEIDFDDGRITQNSYSTPEQMFIKNAKLPCLLDTAESNQIDVCKIRKRPDKPKLKQNEDDEEDIDGGRVLKRCDTVEKLLSKKRLQLGLKQQSDEKQDESEEDDDGAIQVVLKTKDPRKKSEKPKKQTVEYIEDEDGNIRRAQQSHDTTSKIVLIKKPISLKTRSAPENDQDEEVEVSRSRGESLNKKPNGNKVRKTERDDNLLEGGEGRLVKPKKSYDEVIKLVPLTKPKLFDNLHSKAKERDIEGCDNGSISESQTRSSKNSLKSSSNEKNDKTRICDTTKPSYDENRNSNNNIIITTATVDEKTKYDSRKQDQSSTYNQVPSHNNILRTISYSQAQKSPPPPLPSRQPLIKNKNNQYNHQLLSLSPDHSDNDSSVSSDRAISEPNSWSVINHSYSMISSLKSSLNTSTREKQLQIQQQSVKQDNDENTEADISSDNNDDEDQEDIHSSTKRSVSEAPPGISTASPIPSEHPSRPQKNENKKDKILKKKRARFRWYLAYTIINNYRLFDLRKQLAGRLVTFILQRNNLQMESQQQIQPGADTQPEEYRQPTQPQPVFSPVPQSPAERYIMMKASQLFNSNAETPLHSPSFPPPRSDRSQVTIDHSQEFLPGVIQSPSVRTVTSTTRKFPAADEEVRPSTFRQKSQPSPSTAPIIFSKSIPFLGITNSSLSNEPTALSTTSTGQSITFLTVISHQQYMQSWRQQKIEKLRKKHPHCFVYGEQQPLTSNLTPSAILTPFSLDSNQKSASINTASIKKPTPSPFYGYNDNNSIKNIPRPESLRTRTAPISNDTNSNQFKVVSETKGDDHSHVHKHNKHSKNTIEQPHPIPPPRMDLIREELDRPYNSEQSSNPP
ncbi:unnamed protein product [Didymodactylos carnosus]|uniref:Uncharacterized protein n=1 Tax=Didymodactylos carnosus TaxID=1234261 RepID=A0A8S2ERT4_9BILA|nr:unnamed protein product [Didymodactylos carnosus]CAF4030771.1 unnamed protein product [Didymodactylos carnosus]